METIMGAKLCFWLDISRIGACLCLVQSLLAKGYQGKTVSAYLSALGTFREWLNRPRPQSRMISYMLRGESRDLPLTQDPRARFSYRSRN